MSTLPIRLDLNPTLAVNQADRDTTLFAAAQDGNLEALSRLLRQPGANANARDADGRMPLMRIRSHPNATGFPRTSISMAKALLRNVAGINARDNNGITALMSAAQQHNDDLVRYLVQHGADAGAQDKRGNTALMQVVGADETTSNLIRYLCPNKSIANLRNAAGMTALMVLSGTGRRGYNSEGTMAQLVSLAADVNAADDLGDTALMDAAANPAVYVAPDVVQGLLAVGARIDVKNKLGRTAFDLVPPGHANVAELLMAAGVKVPNWDGRWEGTLGGCPVMLCMWMN